MSSSVPSLGRLAVIGALLLYPAVASADLKQVLRSLGEFARDQEETARCTYRETTTVEELDRDDQVLGSEVRVFNVEIKGMEVVRRDIVSITPRGKPLDDLLQQPRETRGRKAARSPLHPEAQPEYRFELTDGPDEGEQTLTIEPLKPSASRMRGVAVIDERTSALKTSQMAPSKPPVLLRSLVSTSEYGDTACGRLPVKLEVKGEGVAIFVETRFRTRSRLEGHRPVPRPVAHAAR